MIIIVGNTSTDGVTAGGGEVRIRRVLGIGIGAGPKPVLRSAGGLRRGGWARMHRHSHHRRDRKSGAGYRHPVNTEKKTNKRQSNSCLKIARARRSFLMRSLDLCCAME